MFCLQPSRGWPDDPSADLINKTLRKHVQNCAVRVFHQLQITHTDIDAAMRLRAYPFSNLGKKFNFRKAGRCDNVAVIPSVFKQQNLRQYDWQQHGVEYAKVIAFFQVHLRSRRGAKYEAPEEPIMCAYVQWLDPFGESRHPPAFPTRQGKNDHK